MDILNLQPDSLGTSDTTFEVEGYEDHIEDIQKENPEVDWRTPAEIEAENEAQQPPSEQPTAQPTAEQPVEQPTEQPQPEEQPKEPTRFTFTADPTTGEIPVEQIQAAYGGKVPEGVIRKLSLTKTWDEDKEGRLRELFSDGNNLQNQLEAFNMIRNDPELVERYDHNEDGEITYADFFDTTNLNGGAGMTDEEDQIATREWLEGLTNPNMGSRLQALWQQNGAGQNMARYINLRREHALSDKGEGSKTSYGLNRNQGEGLRQNTAGGLFDISTWAGETIGSIGDVAQGKSWHEDSTLDDDLFQHKNENSLEYLVNHNLSRSALDTIAYEAGYWAIPSMLTMGAAGKVGVSMKAYGAAKQLPMLVRAGNFLTPTVTGGKLVQASNIATKQITMKTIRPGTGLVGKTFLGKTSNFAKVKAVQGINMLKGTAKVVAIDTIPIAAMTNLQEEGRGMMYEDGMMKKVLDQYPEGAIFAPQIAQGLNSPLFKQADFMATEMVYGVMGLGALGGFGKAINRSGSFIFGELPSIAGRTSRYAQKNLDQLAVSTRSHSTKINAEFANQEYFFKQTQKQLADVAEAAGEQINKAADGFKNSFNEENLSDGLMKNAYGAYKNGSKMLGQGYSKARDGIRQVINDLDEIRHSVGVSNSGSTNALFSQTDMARAGKAGITEKQLDLFATELLDDVNWKAQIDAKNPLTNSRRAASPSALQSLQETILGRDATRVNPENFWGKTLLNQPLNIEDASKLSNIDRWAVQNIEVQDAVNKSLLIQLRDQANAASEMIGKTDVFAVDGPMKRVANNLTVGLHQVKKTQFTWDLTRELIGNEGKITPEIFEQIQKQVASADKRLLQETKEGVNLMTRMMQETGDEDLAGAVLDVFKVSNDVHNWKDFDAWMKQKIVGGEFHGKTQTGDLIHGLQQVMVQSILSGPKTPLRAIMGTTVNSYLNTINEAFGAIIRSPFTNDVASRKASIAKLKGQFELVPEALQIFRRQWNAKFEANIADIRTRYSEMPTHMDELWEAKRVHVEQRGTTGEKAAFYINNITRNLTNNKLFSWSPRALAATDDTFKWLLARSRSKEKAMRTVLDAAGGDHTKITPELLRKAEDIHYNNLLDGDGNLNFAKDSYLNKQFKEVTLTTELEGFSKKLDGLFNDVPQMKPFYLFARTGINGLNFSFKNTPLLGALHKESVDILKHVGDDFTDLARYGIDNANDLANARNLIYGRQAVGGAVVMSMSAMYMGGQLTGNGPADRQLKQQWINAGWKPNHVYIGDLGFDYRSLEPYNVIWSTIADIGDNMELMGEEWAEKRLQAVAFVIGRGLTGKTYMSGLDQMLQIVQNPVGPESSKAVANILNNSVPLAGMRNEFGKWINPHMKELDSDMWTSIRNRNLASEYLTSDPILAKSDLLNGKPINNWNFVGRSFNAISPVQLDIRRDTPGRRLLLNSNYDLKSATYAHGGYSFSKNAKVRAHFQSAIGTVPITIGFDKFKNVEEALDHLATRSDVKRSMEQMKADGQNPSNWDLNPNTYPHNTLIDNVMNQARSKAWAKINDPSHPGYDEVQILKSEKDGHTTRTRDNRSEILELSFPQKRID